MKIRGIELRFDKEVRQALWKLIKVLLDPVLSLLFGVGAVYLLYRLAMWIHHCVTGSAWLAKMAEMGGFSSNWGAILMLAVELLVLATGAAAALFVLMLVWLFGVWLRMKLSDGVQAFRAWRNRRRWEKERWWL